MAYLKLIKEKPEELYEKINSMIGEKVRIHTRDIHYAIRHCDEKIISLMLDNIPTHEYYPCLYGAVVKGNRSTNIIDLLIDKKVPMDDNILIYCIVDDKIDYVKYFVGKDPKLVTVFVLIEALNNNDLMMYFLEGIKKNKLHIEHYEMLLRTACGIYLSDGNEIYKELEKLQEYEPRNVIFYDESKEVKLYQNRGFDIIKQNTQMKTRHIVRAIKTNSISFLTEILPKYDYKISGKILSICKNTEIRDLIKKHNDKYK